MRRSTLAICALLTVAIYGCDTVDKVTAKLKLAWDKVRGKPTATQTAPPRPATDTAAARVAAAAQQQQHPTQRCEYTCGTMDVVTLKNGAVVDAVLRWDGHRYSGESSSPPGKMPVPNVGGDTLRVRPP